MRPERIVETHAAYAEMRGDGFSTVVAAAVLGIPLRAAYRWDQQIAERTQLREAS